MKAPRAIAVEVLVRVEGGAFSHIVLPETLRKQSLDVRDRAFATDLVYGTLRMQRTLDALLEALPLGFVNLHFSLLPRWRGAAPVERAMLAGDTETGVCLMELEAGLDTGPVYASTRVPIGERETAGELRARLVDVGTELLVDHLPDVGASPPAPQVGEPTYADKIDPNEHHLEWTKPAAELHRVVRLGDAWTTFRGKRLKVLRAALDGNGLDPGALDGLRVGAGDGSLELVQVQPEGKGPMSAADWRNGARPAPGERLGE